MPSRSANTLRSRALGTFSVDGRGAAAQHPDVGGQPGQPGVDVVHQPRLADAGLTQHGDDPPGPLGDDRGEGVLELAQLLLAADRAGDHALDAAGLRPEALAVAGDDDVGVDRALDALELQAGHPAQAELAGTWRVVSAESSTVPGRAAACSRAARLAVSPTTRNSPRLPLGHAR